MKFNYKTLGIALSVGVLATSCTDYTWEPGEESNPDAMMVYFEPLKSYNITVTADDSPLIPITISRAKYEQPLTLSLDVISCPDGIALPSNIDFAAGEQSKVVYVDIQNMPSLTTAEVSFNIPQQYTSVYMAGTPNMYLTITKAGQWVSIADDLTISYSNRRFATQTTTLYKLEGQNWYKWHDFMYSGLDFVFTVNNNNKYYTSIEPVTNFSDYTDDYDYNYSYWYLYDTAIDDYPAAWTPDGESPYLAYACICGKGLNGQSDYSWIGLKKGTGSITVDMEFDNERYAWNYISLSFTPVANPYEPED